MDHELRKPRSEDVPPVSASNIVIGESLFPYPPVEQRRSGAALKQHSLQGRQGELEKLAQEQTPLLGSLCLKGQATVWYAQPNTGKTLVSLALITEAIMANRIRGDDVIYVAADDTASGALEKLNILSALGAHVVVPGFAGFSMQDLRRRLREMIDANDVGSTFLVIDTLKKCVSLMDKRESASFGTDIRSFILRGGTVLGLAHTNKKPGADGKPIYAGTTDILEDFDCAYTIVARPQSAGSPERSIEFDNIKRRGDVAQNAAYGYSIEPGIKYADLVKSVRELGVEEAAERARQTQLQSDAAIIAAIEEVLLYGANGKMDLVAQAMKKVKASKHAITAIVERYTGDEYGVHRWSATTGAHGVIDYRVLKAPVRKMPHDAVY